MIYQDFDYSLKVNKNENVSRKKPMTSKINDKKRDVLKFRRELTIATDAYKNGAFVDKNITAATSHRIMDDYEESNNKHNGMYLMSMNDVIKCAYDISLKEMNINQFADAFRNAVTKPQYLLMIKNITKEIYSKDSEFFTENKFKQFYRSINELHKISTEEFERTNQMAKKVTEKKPELQERFENGYVPTEMLTKMTPDEQNKYIQLRDKLDELDQLLYDQGYFDNKGDSELSL